MPRPTATPAPYLRVNPSEGLAGAATLVVAMGELWNPGPVTLYWDGSGGTLLGQATAGADGVFSFEFATPTGGAAAAPGVHVIAAVQGPSQTEASFYLVEPPPTSTPTSTPTPTPSSTWTPTPTSTPVTPSPTPTKTPTFTPSPTLRAMTPMVTITSIPPTRRPPGGVATRTPTPTQTGTPTSTPTGTPTSTPTATQTHTPRPEAPTATPTPSVTATPSHTPGLATFEPSASPEPALDPAELTGMASATTVSMVQTAAGANTAPTEEVGGATEPADNGTQNASTRNLAVMSILLLLGGGAFGAIVTGTGVGLWMRYRRL